MSLYPPDIGGRHAGRPLRVAVDHREAALWGCVRPFFGTAQYIVMNGCQAGLLNLIMH
jgi:hypothetical protein